MRPLPQWARRLGLLAAVGAASATTAHSATADRTTAHPATADPTAGGGKPAWFLYGDAGSASNHGAWSNIMSADEGSTLSLDLADRSRPAAGSTAVRLDFTFGPGSGAWAGIAVASADGYWGTIPGPGFDLRGARRLLFAARSGAGGARIRVKVAIAGDAEYGDSAPLPFDSGWLQLTQDWQTYALDVNGQDLSRLVIPFVVIANRAHNPAGRATVFLDEIRFER